MKLSRIYFILTLMAYILFLAKGGNAVLLESESIKIGTQTVNFSLPGTDGKTYTLDDFKDKEALVLVVTCNHCPYAEASWPVLIDLQNYFADKSVQFVAINPNDSDTFSEDNFENMKINAKKLGLNFPYLRDKTQKIAKQLKAVCTPDIYLYGSERKLFYHGRINDNWQNPQKVKDESLKNAINDLLAGKNPPDTQYPSMGCSIKWK